MNKQQLIDKYNTSAKSLTMILEAFQIDVNTEEFSEEQLQLIERVMHLVRKKRKNYKEAIDMVKNNQDSFDDEPETATMLDPDLTSFLQQKSMLFAEEMISEAPGLMREQKEAARKIIVNSFWNRVNELGRSEEFRKKFDAALYGEDVLDVAVLPGESSALPESSSSDI